MTYDIKSFMAGLRAGLALGRKFALGLITKFINRNGVYRASDDGADGYSVVTVDVPGAGDPAALFDILADCYALNSFAGYDILSSMYVSHTVGDRMTINGRYFQRTTAAPALIVNQTASDVGSRSYVIYSPSQDAFSGTYSEYGGLAYFTTLTSPSGNTFYRMRMASSWVTSQTFPVTISNGGNAITTLKANDFLLNYNLDDSAMVSIMGRIMDALFFGQGGNS